MSNMRKMMPRDEFGYISNQGRSKYWGVSFKTNSLGRDEWIVSVGGGKGLVPTETYYGVYGNTKEEQMAAVAAGIYDSGGIKNIKKTMAVECPLNKSYLLILDRIRRTISRKRVIDVPLGDTILVQPIKQLTLNDITTPDVLNGITFPDVPYTQQVKDARANIIDGVVGLIEALDLSPKEAQLILAAINQTK